ncbi:cupin domain-containing protein [Nocardia sp. NPDC059240]|uniref:(R)-mandelonitrile lyase n=1 Tax=Nocardia sp. NPDC059240 TaxID=3346786 RepID=UPI0036B86343
MEIVKRTPTAKGPADWFTGDVYLDVVFRAEEPARARLASVHFTPCARTAWHRHALGQALHVTEGTGLVVNRDGQVIMLRPGETVWTPPGEEHWHGAAPDAFMTHLALWEGDDVTWLDHVTDPEYQAATSHLR